MSYLKFSPNLFLETIEFNRLKKFLDDDGFRKSLLNDSIRFGLINKQYFLKSTTNQILKNEFLNGQVSEGSSLTIDYEEISALNSEGNFLYLPSGNKEVPADGLWYWVKIKHQFSPIEKGTLSIDVQGNLVGTNTLFTDVLRGEPNFPARIRFINSVYNTLEYDVLEVLNDTNAVLTNSTFVAETDLQYVVVGTFTPNSVPTTLEKDIFQYDDCLLTLEEETVFNTRPVYVDGMEFFLARVRNNGSTLVIQDKRTDIWLTRSAFDNQNVQKKSIPYFGIEKIKFNDRNSTLDKNFVYLSWAFRSINYTVNSNLNIVSIINGTGGKYKNVNYFSDGDFDGYRLYTKDGIYSIIKASVKVGSQINLYLDQLDIDKYSNNGGQGFLFEEIVVTPDAEEIEVICKSIGIEESGSLYGGELNLTDQNFVFPINSSFAKIELFVFSSPASYEISYRLKHVDVYSKEYQMTSDTSFGYYNERAFDTYGDYLPIVQSNSYSQNLAQGYITIYSSNIIQLLLNSFAYSNYFVGDRLGVDNVDISGLSTQILRLTPGINKQSQYLNGNAFSLSNNIFIVLDDVDYLSRPVRNGSYFFVHIKQKVTFGSFKLRIVSNYIDTVTYNLLTELNIEDENFLRSSDEGLYFRIYSDGTKWIINSVNETRSIIAQDSLFTGNFITAQTIVRTYLLSDTLSGSILVMFDGYLQPPSGSGSTAQTSDVQILCNGVVYATKSLTTYDDGGFYPITVLAVVPYVKGQNLQIRGSVTSNICTIVGKILAQGNNLTKY